jgi:DSF synthase
MEIIMNTVAQRKEYYNDTELQSQLKTHYDAKYKIGWFLMDAAPRPCFTPTLLNDISSYFDDVKAEMKASNNEKYDFIVLGSNVENVFNLGGDLDLFAAKISQGDRDVLLKYAMACIDVLYANMTHLNVEAVTVAVVKGDALGGGFEAALSSNLLIAERGVKMGLPEVLFNLFPGMGAFSLLSRKVGTAMAEKMIFSGELYLAEELFEMGVVDILAEKGEAELALYKHIKSANKRANSYKAMQKVKDICNTISYQELVDITNVWVDAALKLDDKDLRMMNRLVTRQTVNSLS